MNGIKLVLYALLALRLKSLGLDATEYDFHEIIFVVILIDFSSQFQQFKDFLTKRGNKNEN